MSRVSHLTYHSQSIGLVAVSDFGVHTERGFELGHAQGALEPQHIEAMTQHIQSATLVQAITQALQ